MKESAIKLSYCSAYGSTGNVGDCCLPHSEREIERERETVIVNVIVNVNVNVRNWILFLNFDLM